MDIERRFQRVAKKAIAVERVGGHVHDRDRHRLAHRIGARHHFIPQGRSLLPEALGLGPQHQVGEIDIPFVGWHIGAFGHVTQVTEITLVNDLEIVALIDPVDLHGVAFVDQVEQRRERIAQADAAATTMADIVNAFEFGKEIFLVPILI